MPRAKSWMSLVLVGVAVASTSACHDDDTTGPMTTSSPTEPASSGAVIVNLQNQQFSPADITIHAGQTVTWTSKDDVAHTVTSGTGPTDPKAGEDFDQPLASSGATFSQKFIAPGTFSYFCRFHFTMGMKGTVTVMP